MKTKRARYCVGFRLRPWDFLNTWDGTGGRSCHLALRLSEGFPEWDGDAAPHSSVCLDLLVSAWKVGRFVNKGRY